MPPPARALALAVVFAPTLGLADERQLTLAGHLGFALVGASHGGPGVQSDAQVAYGITDAFNLYATTGYALEFPDAPFGPRHDLHLSAGVSYAFDHLRAVPYVGLGPRLDLVFTRDLGFLAFAAEARGGVLYLVRRGLALDLQVCYAFPFTQRELSTDILSITLGVGITWDR
jgi:hypothetical protein